jgi:flagellar export protein FliJ
VTGGIHLDRSDKATAQLARLARLQTESLQAQLSELQRAQFAAAAALSDLDLLLKSETPPSGADFCTIKDFSRYSAGAEGRRRTLAETNALLVAQIASARAQLADAFSELKKLEILIDAARRSELRVRSKKSAQALDALAIMRFR